MTRSRILVLLLLFISSVGLAQSEATDLTAVFVKGGIEIDRLQVYKVSDIVLIRGRTSDLVMAARAVAFAKSLGYQRVANLIEFVPGLADVAIERLGARELDMARELEGCSFQLRSIAGVVRLRGRVRHEQQGDLARTILRRIDGVKVVNAELVLATAPVAQQ